jgi:hypothetical protein
MLFDTDVCEYDSTSSYTIYEYDKCDESRVGLLADRSIFFHKSMDFILQDPQVYKSTSTTGCKIDKEIIDEEGKNYLINELFRDPIIPDDEYFVSQNIIPINKKQFKVMGRITKVNRR